MTFIISVFIILVTKVRNSVGTIRWHLSVGFLFAIVSTGAWSETKKADSIKVEAVAGSCPRVEKKDKVVCDTPEDKSVTEYIDVTFPVKASTTIKTKTKLCSKEQLDKLMEREASLSGKKVEKLRAESCTVFFENEKDPKSFLLITELIKEDDSTEDMNLFGMVLLVHENKEELELTAHYENGHSASIDGNQLSSVCDTDGDNRADLIFDRSRYLNSDEQLIFKNLGKDGFSGPESIEGKPGCIDGC